MDIVSHGLWGGIAFGRHAKKAFFIALFFGLLPDLFAFTIVFIQYLLRGYFIHGPIPAIPPYVHLLYSLSHSLIVSLSVLMLGLFIWRSRAWVMAAWPLHILFDIVTHDVQFFPTPFLWPFSTPYVDGIPWSIPWVFWMNWGSLILLYGLWLVLKPTNIQIKYKSTNKIKE